MKKNMLVLMTLFLLIESKAQDAVVKELKIEAEKKIQKDPKDTTQLIWKKGGQFNFTVNQGSQNNWSAGGDKFSFSLNAYLNLFAFYKKDRHSWDNSLDLAYGIVQTTSLGRRKSLDRIDLTSKYGYSLNEKINLATLFNLRSQFANGYFYSKTAGGADSATLNSKGLCPAYFVLSVGLDYKPTNNFSLFLSPVTGRWVVVNDKSIGSFYGVLPGKTVKNELGAFLSANYNKKIGANLTYKTKLDLFSNHKKEPQNIDVFWTNVITAKITKYINCSLNVDMIYDNDTKNVVPEKGPAPQWLQLIGIGFAYNFNKK